MFLRKIDSLVERIRRKGLSETIRRVVRVGVSPIYVNQRLYLIVHDLEDELPSVEHPPGFAFGTIGRDNLELLMPLVGEKRVSSYRRRLDEGMICYALWKGSQVTNFFWCSDHDVVDDILGVRIPVGSGEAYSFDAFTHVDYRHRGLFVALLIFHLHDLRKKGYSRILGCHNPRDLDFVYPRYRENNIPVQIERMIDFRKVLFIKNVRWSYCHDFPSRN